MRSGRGCYRLAELYARPQANWCNPPSLAQGSAHCYGGHGWDSRVFSLLPFRERQKMCGRMLPQLDWSLHQR